jgi:metallo-beta-lactamase family protein
VPIRAQIRTISNYSAHADHSELMDWITERLPAHGAVFLTHGEDKGRSAIKKALVKQGLGADQVVAPSLDDAFELSASGIKSTKQPEAPRIDPAQFSRDWHNEFSDFSIELSRRLHAAKTDKQRLELMQTLQKALRKT